MSTLAGLIADAHHGALMRLSDKLGVHVVGLAAAARLARRRAVVSGSTFKKLIRLDNTFALSRHLTAAKVSDFLGELDNELYAGSSCASVRCRSPRACTPCVEYFDLYDVTEQVSTGMQTDSFQTTEKDVSDDDASVDCQHHTAYDTDADADNHDLDDNDPIDNCCDDCASGSVSATSSDDSGNADDRCGDNYGNKDDDGGNDDNIDDNIMEPSRDMLVHIIGDLTKFAQASAMALLLLEDCLPTDFVVESCLWQPEDLECDSELLDLMDKNGWCDILANLAKVLGVDD
jgi:hypothetical protein